MGVPAFFRWIREKYSKCIAPCIEEELPSDADFSSPNPNGLEYDNLYLDMNGIIHPCARPEGAPPPESEVAMFAAISAYIDRIVCAVRPRKLLYMAIDGVAPRAKMNQQRSRRFKSAREAAERAECEAELRAKFEARVALGARGGGGGGEGGGVLPPREVKRAFDSNVITPGTRFMDRLARHLRYYVAARQATHPAWRSLPVILSDAGVPGEGEHKIMEFIRQQRAQAGYHPGVRHIIHGLDADLIMLGLATHEACFSILRWQARPRRMNCVLFLLCES
jgi:5'-3' exonuclease